MKLSIARSFRLGGELWKTVWESPEGDEDLGEADFEERMVRISPCQDDEHDNIENRQEEAGVECALFDWI